MTKDGSIFCDINASVKSQVRLGNIELVEAKGKGIITIKTKKGTRFIQNVLFVLSLKWNLLNMGQMIQNGYSFHFKEDTCTIDSKNNKSLVIVIMKME